MTPSNDRIDTTASMPPLPIRSEFADDTDMIELIGGFARDLPCRAASLAAAVEELQLEQARRLAHQLKGASAGYGFPQIGSVAARVEQQLLSLDAISDERMDLVKKTVDELTALCGRVSAR